MTHLRIEQNGITEEVSRSLISKLYELSVSGNLDSTSDLKGRLHAASAPSIKVEYLNQKYPDLFISADKLTITFEDAEVEHVLENLLNKTGLDANDLNTITSLNENSGFEQNSNITSLNDLSLLTYCTNIGDRTLNGMSNVVSIKFPPSLTSLSNIEGLPKVEAMRIPSLCTGNWQHLIYLRDMESLSLLVVDATVSGIDLGEKDRKFVAPDNVVINGSVESFYIVGKNWKTWNGTIWVDDVATYQAKSGFSSYVNNLAAKSTMPQQLQDAVNALQ